MQNIADFILLALAAVGFATISIVVFVVICYKLGQTFKINKK